MCMVFMPTTIIYPWAVVVHLQYTSLTFATVMGTRSFVPLAEVTILQIFFIVFVIRFPTARKVPGTYQHGAEEVVKRRGVPHREDDEVQQSPERILGRPPHVAAVPHGERDAFDDGKGEKRSPVA